MMQDNPLTIPEQFRQAIELYADETVIYGLDQEVSFAQLDHDSEQFAAVLNQQGIRQGDRIGLYCINCAQFVVSYLGILKAGAIVVPVNLLIRPDEISYILNNAEVTALVYHDLMAESVDACRQRVSSIQLFVPIQASAIRKGELDYETMIAGERDLPGIDLGADDIAAILYTSGTTGQPKGAVLSHRNLVSNTFSVAAALDLRPRQDRLLVVLPMFHSFAATVGMLTPLLHGLSLIPVPKFEPALVSDAIDRHQATLFLGVPSMYGVILRLAEDRLDQWKSIRFGVSGGAAMPVELMHQFEQRFQFPILEGDGPTECSPVTSVNPLNGVRKTASVGLPVPDVEIGIFDDAGNRIATDEIGEICVRGPNVMQGYWGLPDETRESFFQDWFRTGDLGYLDEDGYIFMVDRKKDMIIVNGMNVYPRMVEEVLYKHPEIAEAAVVGEPHATHGETVVAHVVLEEGSELTASEIKSWSSEQLGQHQRPRKIVMRSALPKNATGKILKRELRKTGEIERGIDSR
ncbi:MAG: long-chain fatty acid--CoA ligase [Pseudomonadota bacterium]